MITETLGPGHLTFPAVFSDSALKSCFYYPVCRCQRTSGLRYSGRQKNPTLSSDDESRFRSSCRDKIEFQFAVPEYPRARSCRFRFGSPVSGGVSKIAELPKPSTHFRKIFWNICGSSGALSGIGRPVRDQCCLRKDAEETRRLVEEHRRKCIIIPGDIW